MGLVYEKSINNMNKTIIYIGILIVISRTALAMDYEITFGKIARRYSYQERRLSALFSNYHYDIVSLVISVIFWLFKK